MEPRVTIKQEDVSMKKLPRVRLEVVIEGAWTKDGIRDLVLRVMRPYRDGNKVIFLFLYQGAKVHGEDYVCRALWVRPGLPKRVRPTEWPGERVSVDKLRDVMIDWHQNAFAE